MLRRDRMLSSLRGVNSDREKEKELCRICFSRKPTFLDIFETYVTHNMTIADMFIQCLGDNIYPDDDLPEFICCDCIEEILEMENINEDFKMAVRHSVWRTKLLKEMESIEVNKRLTRTASTIAIPNFFSGDNEYSEKKIQEGCRNNSSSLSSNNENESSDPSDNFKNNIRIRMMGEMILKNCPDSCLHECSICRGVFFNAEDLSNHKNLFHEVRSGFPCGMCHKNFKTVKRLEKHVEKYSFMCKSNGSVKAEENIENSPTKSCIMSPSAPIVSEIDETTNDNFKGFLKKIEVYSCSKCDCTFESDKALRAHLRETHSIVSPCVCKLCGIGFMSRIDLALHSYIHPKQLSCDVCKKMFFSPKFYKKHIKFCQERIIVYKCQICGKEVVSKVNMKLHLRTHSTVKRFECHICQKRYFKLSHLYAHIRSFHLKQKPHKCDICNKSFDVRGNLFRHLSTHSDERPYGCSICQKRFKTSNHKNTHEKVIHNVFKPQKVKIIVDEDVLEKISL